MKNMNELRKLQDMKAPEELKQRTLAAAREARRAQQESAPQHRTPAPRRRFGMAKRILAAACAFGVIVGGTAVWRAQGTGQSAGEAVAEAVAHSFGIVAYAVDTGETIAQKDSKIVFDSSGGGGYPIGDGEECDFYSGCLFRVTGDNIQTVSAEIDRGSFYRHKKNIQISSSLEERRAAIDKTLPAVQGAKNVNLSSPSLDPDAPDAIWYVDADWPLANEFSEQYDPEALYGFRTIVPTSLMLSDNSIDLQNSVHNRINYWDGATLTVTVTFTDGTTDTQTLTLHTGKLGVEYTDGTSGPQLTGEVLTDEQAAEQGYVYGIYAEIEE